MSLLRVSLSTRQLREWRNSHPTLAQVFDDLCAWWPREEIFVTRIGATADEDRDLGASGVHSSGPPWRAIDVRITSLGDGYQALADSIASKINARWVYDPSRPQLNVVVSKLHGSGPHVHCQVHDKTVRRK